MNLHISLDDKFLDTFIRQTEEFTTTTNRFVVLSPTGHRRFVKDPSAIVVAPDTEECDRIMEELGQYDSIFVHYMNLAQVRLVNRVPAAVPVVWIFYGAEAFSLPQFRRKLYGPITARYVRKTNHRLHRLELSLNPVTLRRNIWNYIFRRREWAETVRAMRRVNYFAHFVHEDYEWVRKKLGIGAQFIQFNMGVFQDGVSVDGTSSRKTVRQNILLGNSGDVANNHAELIERLARFPLKDRKVIVPLSYAGTPSYVEHIGRLARARLGSNCNVLEHFLPRAQYDMLLKSCGVFVMNHYRSQAAGNISRGVAFGAKLYMSERSNLYGLYKRLGLRVFSTERDLNPDVVDALSPLDRDLGDANRAVFRSFFGKDAVRERYARLYDVVASHSGA